MTSEVPVNGFEASAPDGSRKYDHDGAKKNWKYAVRRTKDISDPWENLGFENIPEETVVRYMYNSRHKKWRTDEAVVKIQPEPFAHGAMRECFRMKKLSKFSQNPNWQNASNYVAKRYMKEASTETYYDDVKLQMDSKLWGEEYSKLNIPKKVDFCQTYVIEFKGRPGCPVYCVEHFIDGGYIKYNSNSGFVSDVNRLTPQAFSHFTFERSNHQLIIVDIQGVGDLYTDPQMHTVDQKEYGEANLGTRGMALFFSTHICSPLCEALKLTQFDLSYDELHLLRTKRWNFSSSTTRISDVSLEEGDPSARHQVLASDGCTGNIDSNSQADHDHITVGDLYRRLSGTIGMESASRPAALRLNSESDRALFSMDSPLPLDTPSPAVLPDVQVYSSSPLAHGSHFDKFWKEDVDSSVKMSVNLVVPQGEGRSASVEKERTRIREEEEEKGEDGINGEESGATRRRKCEEDGLDVLGLIHLDLARYHEVGRLSEDNTPNTKLSLYHLQKAAHCGVKDALYVLAHIYLQAPHDDFKELTVEGTAANECMGMDLLVQAAEKGMKSAMLEVAKALDTGVGLGQAPEDDPAFTAKQRHQDWLESTMWYRRSIEPHSGEDSSSDEDFGLVDPVHSILSRMAEMHHSGGHGLPRDLQTAGDLYSEAAEAAMSAMKGKLSNKYFMLAEQVWAEMED